MMLQQSIEAFSQSIASQNPQQHGLPVPTVPSFSSVMCALPQHQVSASIPMSLGGVSSSSATSAAAAAVRKRGHYSTFPISEDESDLRKRKSDRNAREQQRAQQVTDQIAHLRDLIVKSGVALEKVDKFSTLIAVEKYIRSLQTKSIELKTEHDNLLATLQQTSELVNSQYVSSAPPNPVSSGGEESCQAQDSSDQETDDHSEGDTTSPLMKDVNYKWIFDCCPFATGVASIDGRFLDCNKEFEVMTGYTRAELLPLQHQSSIDGEEVGETSPDNATLPSTPKKSRNMSIFNVLHRECIERLFCAMSIVLQKCNNTDNDEGNSNKTENDDDEEKCNDTITQEVTLCKRSNAKVGFWIAFQCLDCLSIFSFMHFNCFTILSWHCVSPL
jgi:PAS domain-containing protein